MPHYFYPIDGAFFHQQIRPILGQCRRERSLAPGRALCTQLLPRVHEFHASYAGLAGKTLVEDVVDGLTFDPDVWRAVVGEVLLFAAEELPLLRIAATTLCCLLAGERFGQDTPRSQFTPIQQILFGSRDLVFGSGFYRPDFAGWNDLDDVIRLAGYLEGIDPESWRPADLLAMPELADDEEREEELAFVRQSWPELVEMYRKARAQKRIMACEVE